MNLAPHIARRLPPLRGWVVIASLLAGASTAWAGGLEVGDTGAEALGRGGAFSAKADNGATINYNPAGFVKLRGHHVTVGGNMVLSRHDFTRTGYFSNGPTSKAMPYPMVSSENPMFAAPRHMMVTTDFGYFNRVTFAAGMYVPSAAGGAYPKQVDVGGVKMGAPQRFTAVQTEGLIFYPTAAIAFRPVHWLDIGLSFQAVVTSIKTTNIVTAGSACDVAEDPACDITIEIDAKDVFTPSGSAGVLVRPSRHVELGAMVRLPSRANLEGKANITLGPALKKLQGSLTKPMVDPLDPAIRLNNDYPWMVRAGIRYIFRDGDEEVGDIEADFIYEGWSAASKRSIEIQGNSLGKPMEPTKMDWGLKDTYALRLGGAYKLRITSSLSLVLRAGTFFETATTEVSDTSLSVLGPRRLGITGGIGLRWGRFTLDGAYAHIFLPDREVNRSTVRVQDFGGDEGPVVGNGYYSASVDMFAVQLSVAFGRGATQYRQGRVPRLPHDPGYDMKRDGVFVKKSAPQPPVHTPGVRSYSGGVRHHTGGVKSYSAGTTRYSTRRPRRVKSYDPDAMEFEPEDVSLSSAAPAQAPETREASRPSPRRKARRTRRSRRRGYRRGRRGIRRTSTRKRRKRRKRRSVCVEHNAEGDCVRARMIDGVVK